MNKVHSIYVKRGFIVATYVMDNEFEPLRDYIQVDLKSHLETSPANDHVPVIERQIRFLKEKFRSE